MSDLDETRKMLPGDVLQHMRVEDCLYVLGCRERRVTFRSQQIRALNLVYSLRKEGIVSANDAILIVGGGVAGLTAAVGASRLGLRVTLLEREQELLHLQRGTAKRWIHPHIYDWPTSGSSVPEADLPVLSWRAGSARDVVKQFLDALKALPAAERARIDDQYGARITDLGSGPKRHVFWSAKGNQNEHFSAVILAVGFGLEREVKGVDFASYWHDEALDQNPLKDRNRTLISGTGDGGLIDVLRANVRDFRHETMIEDFVGDPRLDPVKERLLAVEKDALRHESTRANSGAEHLFKEYERLSKDHADELASTVDSSLHARLREDVTVVLNGREPTAFSLGASILSRFLISRLYFTHKLIYQPGELKYKKRKSGSGEYEVMGFRVGGPQFFDRVICRHGPVGALEGDFPDVWKHNSGKLRDLGALDQTRWPIFPRGYFDPAPGSGAEGTGPSGEPESQLPPVVPGSGPTLASYLARLREVAGQVKLAGDVEYRPLQDVFVELEVTRGGTIEGQRPGEEDDPDRGATPGDRLALQTELRRRKSAPWRRLTETVPADDLLDFAHRTLILGAAGTGKSTLLRWLACQAAKRRESDDQARIPIWLDSLPPHKEVKADLAGTLTKRALAALGLDEGSSSAARTIREAIESGRALVLIDSLDESGVAEQEHAAAWLTKLKARVVLASRPLIDGASVKDVTTVTLHGIPGIAAEQLLRNYFVGEDWVDGLLDALRSLPDGQTWLETPVLLGLASTLYRANRTLPRTTIDLYRRAVDHLLSSETVPETRQGNVLRKELQIFARERLLPGEGAPRVIFDSNEVTHDRWEIYKRTGLFEGGSRVRFTHLTLGEFLAAEAEIDLAAERTKLLGVQGHTSEGSSLEVVPMAHALRGTAALQEALAEARERDLSDHRLLRLLLRALGYGGEGVHEFCSTHAGEVIRLVAGRLDAPSGRFGEAETALMDAAERAFLAMRGLVDKVAVERAFARLLRLPHDVGTEAHVATWILEVRAPERRESNWWPTVERQARALVRANVGIDEVLRLTQGVDSQNQWRAAGYLAKYPELWPLLRPLLYHDDDMGRRWVSHNLASDIGAEPDWRERLVDEDRHTRERCVRVLAESLDQRSVYLPRLRDMLARDPDDDVRAAVVDALANDPFSREAIRDILSITLRSSRFVSSGAMGLRGAAIRALATDPASEELLRGYVSGPKIDFFERKETLQKLLGVHQLRHVLLQRLSAPDVNSVEVEALAEEPDAQASLCELLDSPNDVIVNAAIEALGGRADVSRLTGLLNHDSERLRCAAITALGKHGSTESILRPFLTGAASERVAAAKALARDTESLESIRYNLLRYTKYAVRLVAIEVLSGHSIALPALREYFEETRSSPDIEWLKDDAGRHVDTIFHGMLRGRVLAALARDERYRVLVESSLDDPHSHVRGVAVKMLAGDADMADRLRQYFYLKGHEHEVYEAICSKMSDYSFVRDHLLYCLNADLGGLRFSAFRYLVDRVEDRRRLRAMLSSDVSEDWRATIVGPLMRDPTSMDAVRGCVDDESKYVRKEALRLLRHDRRVREEFRERAKNREWLTKLVRKSLAPFGRDLVPAILSSDPDAHPILAAYLASDDEDILAFVAPLLREYSPSRPRLVELLEHSSVDVRCGAMRALGEYEPVRMKILSSLAPDPPVMQGPDTDMSGVFRRSGDLRNLRSAAADALKDVPECRTEFRVLLNNEDKEIRAAAIHSVAADRSPEALRLLRERLGVEKEEDLRFQIIEALRADPGSVEPLRARVHNDHHRAVRSAAAHALGLGDLSPAYPARELPPIARIRRVLMDVATSGLEALSAFLKAPRGLDLDAEPELGVDVLAWSCARLTWAYELEREQDGQILGEVAASLERLPLPGGVILIRVAMDAFSLPRERFLRPNHNLMEVWEVARHLVAADPPTVVLACADVAFAHIQPPPLEPGEVRFGPTFFGFRIRRGSLASP